MMTVIGLVIGLIVVLMYFPIVELPEHPMSVRASQAGHTVIISAGSRGARAAHGSAEAPAEVAAQPPDSRAVPAAEIVAPLDPRTRGRRGRL